MSTFVVDLQTGKHHENLIAKGFAWHGIQLTPTEGKHPFDFHFPNGQSLEVKLDLFSAISGNAAIEYPTLQRGADYFAHTFCITKIFTLEDYQWLYQRGKMVKMGDQMYEGRLPSRIDFKSKGKFLDQFAKQLTQQQ